MKSKAEIKVVTLMILGILFTLSQIISTNFSFNFENINQNLDLNTKVNLYNDNLKISKVSGKIYISGDSGWANTKTAGICTGLGTSNDPYIIEDLVIDGGGSGSCIWIENSDVYFKIENCTLFNAGVNWGDGGVRLFQVDNGQIINNSANNNDFIGIILQYCQNTNISGNTANSNTEYGIGLWYSHYNIISNNIFKFNGWGLSFETCHKNSITGNNANDNINDGIGIWNSFKNIISKNEINDNDHGLSLYSCIYNDISENTITNNYVGIDITDSQCNDILNNNFSGNTFNTYGTQGVCTTPIPSDPPHSDPPPGDPPPYIPLPFNPFPTIIAIIGIAIASVVFLAVMFKRSRRHPSQKVTSVDETREQIKIKKSPIIKTSREPEIESKVITSSEVKKHEFVKEEIIQSTLEEKSEELEHFEEEVGSEKEEIIEEEQLIEEKIVPIKEILEEDEKIVKDTIEAPKIEIFSCQFCGMELSSDVIFCVRCGQKVKK